MQKPYLLLILVLGLFLNSCKTLYPTFTPGETIPSTDYSNLNNWAAHPDKSDPADRIPGQTELSDQSTFPADIFFVHPTIYTKFKGDRKWNALLEDENMNEDVDSSTILLQASAFNQAGRVFAPRYRQAHIYGYYTDDKVNARKAFEIAYKDVKEAFENYLKYHNNGRPIIIASHSQGTTHSALLIKEFFDGKPLQKQLVAAYLLGMPVSKKYYENISPCENANDVGCIISWRTFKINYNPSKVPKGDSILVTNPLSWKTNDEYVPKSANLGGVMLDFAKVRSEFTDAQVNNGVLWASKPKFPFSFLYWNRNYHPGDINFYYYNIQQNAIDRINSHLKK
jgi:hypothetical protein